MLPGRKAGVKQVLYLPVGLGARVRGQGNMNLPKRKGGFPLIQFQGV